MMPQHFKKTFSIAIFSFIFFSSFLVNIANAEVTCCACTGHRISYSGERGGMRGTSGIDAVEFSCAEGNPGCETICDRDNAGWRALEEHATGEVVTCCKCRDDTRVCANVNQTCSSEALCGTTPGFMSGGMWKREPGGEINASAETTKDEASKVELIPPNLNIDIPGAGNLFGGGQIVTEGEERYFYLPYIGEYVSALYNYVLGIVGILAVVVIIFAGGIWLTAGGSPERIKTAQEYIFGAVTGVVLAFGSYLILYTINPDLVRFDAMKVQVIENIPSEGMGFGGYDLAPGQEEGDGGSSGRRGNYCRHIPPPEVFRRPRATLQLDRINIRGENETRCPGGTIYPRNLIDAVLAAQESTGIPAGFLLAQAQHETRGFRETVESGSIPSMLWGRKCPSAPLSGAAKEVYVDSNDCTLARQPIFLSQLRGACQPPACQVLRTIEPCQNGSNQTVPTWACFTNVEGMGGIATAAMSQAEFYRDRIGRSCGSCGTFDQYEGSVIGFAARMSCSLFGGFLNSKWDNCLYSIIKQNCLEDSRNTDFIRLSEVLGPSHGACAGGVDARDPSLCADPFDSAKIANPSARWCDSSR